MPRVLDLFRFVLITVAGWMNQRQLQVIAYLREENQVLREQVGARRLRLIDDQLAGWRRGPKGWDVSSLEVATIVTPETLLARHRKLIAQKYEGSAKRGPGRRRSTGEIEALVVRMAQENRVWSIGSQETQLRFPHHRRRPPVDRSLPLPDGERPVRQLADNLFSVPVPATPHGGFTPCWSESDTDLD